MDVAAAFVKNSAIGDVMSQGVPEGILSVGKKLCCVEKLGSLQIVVSPARR